MKKLALVVVLSAMNGMYAYDEQLLYAERETKLSQESWNEVQQKVQERAQAAKEQAQRFMKSAKEEATGFFENLRAQVASRRAKQPEVVQLEQPAKTESAHAEIKLSEQTKELLSKIDVQQLTKWDHFKKTVNDNQKTILIVAGAAVAVTGVGVAILYFWPKPKPVV